MQASLSAARQPWLRWVALIWLAGATYLLWNRWGLIQGFSLSDTDDNLRIAQVRDWLNGQGWFDVRQYRLDPPGGADIHWSRVVDLPIAAIIVALKPLFGGAVAETAAVAVAPLLPLFVALAGICAVARRLIAPWAFMLAGGILLCAGTAMQMFAPLRIDHHGWQLAMLALLLAGLTDPRAGRGGAIIGVASAVSLAIGLEMLPYLALAGAAVALRWIMDPRETPRLRTYALALAGGASLGFALFASLANRAPVCDALSPVWLSAALAGGALLFGISYSRAARWPLRLLVAVLAGGALTIAFILVWPHCLGRPEGVSPELDRLWLSNIREAKPIYEHRTDTIIRTVTLPIVGLVGGLWALWRARGTAIFASWVSVLAMSGVAAAMLLWQARAGPAAQLLAAPGATALGWMMFEWARRQRRPIVRVGGVAAAFVIATGLFANNLADLFPEKAGKRLAQVRRASSSCTSLAGLRPIAELPPTTIMTMVDLGPRLIATTHHRAIASPHHRNGAAILDLHHAWGGTPERARAIARRHDASLLLICRDFAEGTVYRSRAPNGFYARLDRGERFDWLDPVALPKGSNYRLWRVR